MIAFNGHKDNVFPPLDIQGWSMSNMGDSVTFGYGLSSTTKRYTDLLAVNKSLQMYNVAVSGQTLTANQFREGLKEQLTGAYGKQLITILGGTNDWYFSIPLGHGLSEDYFTIRGATNYFISEIRKNSADSEILFLLPTYRSLNINGIELTEGEDPINAAGYTIKDYSNAIKERCIQNKVRYLDLYNITGLETQDGLHPNDEGHIQIENELINYFL